MKEQKNNGITLIALVITIIILLILAGISIAMLTGENGLLSKATIAGEETKKAAYQEVLELIGAEIRPEKVLEGLDTKEFMDRYEAKIKEEIKEGNNLKEATVLRKSNETIYVTTKEGWVYKVTENKVELLGKKGENPAPDLQETDIELETNPKGYTKGNVKVKIIVTNEKMKKYTLQYSKNGEKWGNYTGEFEVTENGPIHARLMNELDEVGAATTKSISNIDREKPNKAEVSFSSTSTDTDNSITATVTQSDSGSGVAITSCKWDYRKSNQKIGENEEDYKGGSFKSNPEKITLQTYLAGTYYLHVLTIDKLGYKTETIEGPITVAQGSYQEIFSDIYTKTETYTDEKGKTARIPEGFAVGVTPWINNIEGGLVITDQIDSNHRSTGNEFVWVPVNNTANFKRRDGYTNGNSMRETAVANGYCSEPYTGGTQEEKDWYTAMYNSVTNSHNKGFYIGRYEAGKEDGKVVVKKNKTVFNNIGWNNAFNMNHYLGGAVELASNFVKTMYTDKGKTVGVESSLVYGIQWDATMQFFDNNYINGTPKTGSYVNDSRGKGWYDGSIHNTGVDIDTNASNKAKNIYDMAGNVEEWTMEARDNSLRILRGGPYNENTFSVSSRHHSQPQSAYTWIGFRIALYVNS